MRSLYLGIAAAVFLCAIRAHAAPIALSTTNTSSVDASVYSTIPADYTTTANPVTALPYAAPSTADGAAGDFSTVTAALTTSEFSFTYSENLANPADYYADADGDILFIPGNNVQYSITGTETVSSPANFFIVDLTDNTLAQTAYAYQQSDSDSLDLATGPSDGALTGTLNPGDTYEFYADQDMNNGPTPDPTLTGSVTITFTTVTPEPTTAASLLLAAAAPAIGLRRDRRRRHAPHNSRTRAPLTQDPPK